MDGAAVRDRIHAQARATSARSSSRSWSAATTTDSTTARRHRAEPPPGPRPWPRRHRRGDPPNVWAASIDAKWHTPRCAPKAARCGRWLSRSRCCPTTAMPIAVRAAAAAATERSVTQPADWGVRFQELAADAGQIYARTLRRYNELLDRVARKELTPEDGPAAVSRVPAGAGDRRPRASSSS